VNKFKPHENDFALLTVPFTFYVDKAPTKLDGFNRSFSNTVLKKQFKESGLIKFFPSLKKDKFSNRQSFAMKMLVLFASSYTCEQTFSHKHKQVQVQTFVD